LGCQPLKELASSKSRSATSVGSKISTGTGVGLRNTGAGLKFLYSADASLRLTVSEDRMATVRLILPALNAQPASVARHPSPTLA
jgi:hypothetical protein